MRDMGRRPIPLRRKGKETYNNAAREIVEGSECKSRKVPSINLSWEEVKERVIDLEERRVRQRKLGRAFAQRRRTMEADW